MRRFVLGNGRSRLVIDPTQLKNYGKVYGCNALYRECEPDYLIAVDPKMIIEINKSGWQNTHEVWTNPNQKYKGFQNFNFFKPSLGWSSGPTALDMASKHGAAEIYILGFDYDGVDGKFNNVYADTENYKKSHDHATYYGNWLRQTETVIKNNRETKYFRIVGDKFHDAGWYYPNFRNINFRDFINLMSGWS
jgi:hypothetical protein